MMRGLCFECAPISISGLMTIQPSHCYGTGDRRPHPGVLGGFRCSCECRTWPRPTKEKKQ